mmetsp:Transcript_4513/g.17133  ORF Transcript_4513/g.17133 Transcript_4513/m.17133 type:complete len:314 (-) Transcript_4513:348-1289(-)
MEDHSGHVAATARRKSQGICRRVAWQDSSESAPPAPVCAAFGRGSHGDDDDEAAACIVELAAACVVEPAAVYGELTAWEAAWAKFGIGACRRNGAGLAASNNDSSDRVRARGSGESPQLRERDSRGSAEPGRVPCGDPRQACCCCCCGSRWCCCCWTCGGCWSLCCVCCCRASSMPASIKERPHLALAVPLAVPLAAPLAAPLAWWWWPAGDGNEEPAGAPDEPARPPRGCTRSRAARRACTHACARRAGVACNSKVLSRVLNKKPWLDWLACDPDDGEPTAPAEAVSGNNCASMMSRKGMGRAFGLWSSERE